MRFGFAEKQSGKFGSPYTSIFFKRTISLSTNIYVVGHTGYIGSHVFNYLVLRGHSVYGLDCRKSDISEIDIKANDIVLDCSRIKVFDPLSLEEDYVSINRLLKAISEFNATYVRIGSVLEIDPQAKSTPYIEWSRHRSEATTTFASNANSKLILVPNIYGGIGSSSIIDELKSSKKTGQTVSLDNPSSKRDFLSMNRFLAALYETLFTVSKSSPATIILTSGFLYEVKSIQLFLEARGKSILSREQCTYITSGEVKEIADSLVEYLLDY